jgi:hypothetical protein
VTPDEHMNAIKRLSEKCEALEEVAGISQAMHRARDGRLIPLGAIGDPVSRDEYFADDYLRRGTRNAYFAVQDVALRKQLISAERELDVQLERSFEADMAVAKSAVLAATAQGNSQPWGKAAGVAVAAVAFGYWVYGLVGAIAGAVGGFFIGQGVVAEAKARARATLEQAKQELEQLRKEKELRALHPPMFSHSEQRTGEREDSLDRDSAHWNVLQFAKASHE